jgi:broad specificity phosphatase PhoE
MRLILVRHGETEDNKAGILQGHLPGKLTPEGHRQALLVAKRLAAEGIDHIYCSDLERTKETARYLADLTGIQPAYHEGIRERSLGVFEGGPGQAYYDAFEKSDSDRYNFKPENGESMLELQARTDAFLSEYCFVEAHMNKTLVLVTHGGVVVTVLATLLDATLEEMLERRCRNTAVSILDISSDKQVSVTAFNCCAHLS